MIDVDSKTVDEQADTVEDYDEEIEDVVDCHQNPIAAVE